VGARTLSTIDHNGVRRDVATRAVGRGGVERRTEMFLDRLAARGGNPLEQLSPLEARQTLADIQSGALIDRTTTEIDNRTISVDRGTVKLTVVRPAGTVGVLPAFMFFHGGGWIFGDFQTHERMVRDLVAESATAAVCVDYDRSPEARYPTAVHQAYAATRWVADHGREIGLDGGRLAVVGNCAGGNLATVVSLMAKDRGAPLVAFQVLFCPITDAAFDTGSYEQFAEGHFLTRNMMQWFWATYTNDPRERLEVYASPLRARTERLRGVPPALILTAEMDVLRDEGESYARALDRAGVEVTAIRYNGMIHDFAVLNTLCDVPGARSALLQASTELKKRLNEMAGPMS
jgi:acetyl esterase